MGKKNFLLILILIVVCIPFFSIIRPTPVLAAGDPIAWWKFDDGSGTAPVDSSGNNITGVFLTPNPTWSTDVPSSISFSDPYSLDLTGTHDGVTFAWPSGLNFAATAPRSFSFWYKPVADGEADSGEYDRIISWDSDQFEIAGTTSGRSNHSISYYDGGWHSTSLTLTLGVWYHITFTYDGTTAKFYIGNDLKDSHGLGGRSLSGTMAIGTRQSTHDEGINGRIDDFRIYNYALDSTQIENLTAGSNNPDAPPSTPTPTPTITPAPTTTPTITPTAASSSSSSSNSNSDTSSNTQKSCSDSAPTSSPDLFQISTSPTAATVYFTPVSPSSGYIINYGTTSEANQFAVSFDDSDKTGAVAYTINSLSENTSYYFKVQGKNGCQTGSWSQIVSESTTGAKKSEILPTTKPTPVPQGNLTVVKKTETSTEKRTEPKPVNSDTSNKNGYDLTIKVETNGKPIEGATVEVHSVPRKAKTDKNGIARFPNIDKGNHQVFLSYNGYSGKENISVNGPQKNVTVSMKVEMNPSLTYFSLTSIIIILILTLIILFFIFLFWKRRKKEPHFS